MDFSLCLADPTKNSFVGDFELLHEDLRGKGTVESVSLVSLYKYIVATYDKESPFVVKYKDWSQRRKVTAKYAGFQIDKETGRYKKEAERIILGLNGNVTAIVIRYLFLQNDVDFINLAGYQALYFKQMKAAFDMNYENPASYEKLQKNISYLSEIIKSIQRLIFRGDETNEYRMRLYEFANRISLDITPEDIAMKKESGENIVDFKPYEEGYEIEKLGFIGDE